MHLLNVGEKKYTTPVYRLNNFPYKIKMSIKTNEL